jgi:hypothetical protein
MDESLAGHSPNALDIPQEEDPTSNIGKDFSHIGINYNATSHSVIGIQRYLSTSVPSTHTQKNRLINMHTTIEKMNPPIQICPAAALRIDVAVNTGVHPIAPY